MPNKPLQYWFPRKRSKLHRLWISAVCSWLSIHGKPFLLGWPQHKQTALYPYRLEDSLFCLIQSWDTILPIPCFHEVGHSTDNIFYYRMSLLSFWHLRLHFCLSHQQANILDKSKMDQTVRLIFTYIYSFASQRRTVWFEQCGFFSANQAAIVEKHGLQPPRCEAKGRYSLRFFILLIHLPSKHNGHLLVNCRSTHFINSQM